MSELSKKEIYESKIKRVILTKEEIDAAISENSGEADKWIEDKNARGEKFKRILKDP